MATADILTPTSFPMAPGHMPSSSYDDEVNALKGTTNGTVVPSQAEEPVRFDAQKHIQYSPPLKVHTMKELGYSDDVGVSSIGVSEPFPLFTPEAINQMRKEILNEKVWEHYQFSSNLAHCQLRGYAAEYAPFVYDAWQSPDVLKIVSNIAGIDLVPAMDWEIAHINISVPSQADKGQNLTSEDDDEPIVDWHTDSYPFVCVTMLSDCTNMVGGETALRKGDGSIVKVRGPQMGCAVVLQGRYIEHQALRALGGTERITMVTSFRPRSPALPDDTVLTTVRAISDLSELYFQFSEYRLEILEERVRMQLKEIRDRKKARRNFNTKAMKKFLLEQEKFLAHMNKEMVEDELVTKGFTDDSHLISEELKERHKKRTSDDGK
ncbi:hypothetical protein RJZ56_000367 [Blastomyces dermatitidis]|uniref:Fe2OG dioxygenase domain-containing protein n=2 Tax=Ajellomyces dermatitidis TaxID=5039 RepID=F2T2U5_AJEDA|nr:uncharacterized protein BDCG_03747 [Blastomyces dermatitidis ER-3]XP_045280583.1 hypothetical protein, variant 1 [Blastomyces dermatitidis ER-3]XP_045280584.1 hypothetical protein, variant 2 [Blastomyces dermatitidis ER-3]EGE77205.1 hypothetical protein BDDG_00142 [Blastomyces dermatitidis ATCC 18188]EQL38724.1 hypothetical protein BDFG_00271 [Blastomyces dermatitidis ATCC 26199]EEQ88627.1 hypothetical protein BDCG_03747 [Blastomyces dermatitidis ER-3]EQL38725.1 hypothetical protein, varia